MAITGHSLIVVDMTFFNIKAGAGSNTVIMLMAMIEGYISDKSVGMVLQAGFLTGNSGQPVAVFMGRGGFTVVAVTVDSFRHKIISL